MFRIILILGLLASASASAEIVTKTPVLSKTLKTNGQCTSNSSCRVLNGAQANALNGTVILGYHCVGYIANVQKGKCEYTLGYCLKDSWLNTATKQCAQITADPEPQCVLDEDCYDKNACTSDMCVGGTCLNFGKENCTSCANNADCNTDLTTYCEYVGEEGWARETQYTEECVPEAGWESGVGACMPLIKDQSTCDAGCNDGLNTGCFDEASFCDDGNPCTQDMLDAFGVCMNEPAQNYANCNDSVCTWSYCWDGECQIEDYNPCEDGNVCTDDTCVDNENGGGYCSRTAVEGTVTCDDGSACTSNDVCANKSCSGTIKTCSDGNACTVDSCVANTGACSNQAKNCDDGNSCTTDSCDSATGNCVNVGTTCNDNNACTTDSCTAAGACVNTAKSCDDNIVCTSDSCDSATGACVNAANTAACNDGSACTSSDVCANKVCGGTAVVCNDNNACTTDSCNPVSGCVFTTISGCVPPTPGKQANLVNLTSSNQEILVACTGSNPNFTTAKKSVTIGAGATFSLSDGVQFCWAEIVLTSGTSWNDLGTYEARLPKWQAVFKITDGSGQEIAPVKTQSGYDIGFAAK